MLLNILRCTGRPPTKKEMAQSIKRAAVQNPSITVAPNLKTPGTSFMEDNFPTGHGGGGWFGDDSRKEHTT